MELFTPQWLAAAVDAAAAGDGFPTVDLTVEYRCVTAGGQLTHHQVFAGGRLEAWARGPAPAPAPALPGRPGGPGLVLRQPLDAHVSMLARGGRGDGNPVLQRTLVVDPASGRGLPPAPLDELALDWASELPAVPTAGPFVVRQVLTHAPYGTVTTWHRVVEARLAGGGLGEPPGGDRDPVVVVRRRFADAMAERSGRIDVLESLQRGAIEGETHLLLLLLGIYDSDECRDGRLRLTTPATRQLAALGELLASPGWRAVTRMLAA